MEEEKKYLDYEGLQTYHTNLCNIIEDNEQVTAAALNNLDDRLKDIADVVEENEEIVSTALNDLNDRMVENEEIVSTALNDLNDKISSSPSISAYTKTETDLLLANKVDKVSAYTKTETDLLLANKVDKVSGKGLSTNDYTTYEKNKLSNIESGALKHKAPTTAEVKSALGTGSGTSKYLREDGTWQKPSNTGTVTSVAVKMNGSVKGTITTSGTIDLGSVITSYGDMFYGQCSTNATTQEKVATISKFLLVTNGNVAIHFTKTISVDGATLNINSTGAKPIYYHGAALTRYVVKADNVVILQYDGTRYNIVGIEGLQSKTLSDLWVDMELPSGLKWARRNIDLTQANKFAASEFQYECTFFSWGNTEGHNPISSSAFDYNWGSVTDDGPYASTPGAALTANIPPSQDAARANLGAPWRMPKTEEYAELFANIDYVQADGTTVIDAGKTNKLVTVNGITGIYLRSKINGNLLFFPCSGAGYETSWDSHGSNGLYWSSSLYSSKYGYILGFNSGGVYPQGNNYRFIGYAVRAVQ